jgi:hypothetical protein
MHTFKADCLLSFLFLFMSILSCNSNKLKEGGQERRGRPAVTHVAMDQVNTDSLVKEMTATIYHYDDTTSIVHAFTDINGTGIFIALLSDIETIDKESKIDLSSNNLEHLRHTGNLVFINGKRVDVQKIRDSQILLPSYVQYKCLEKESYIVVEMNLVSFVGGNGWCSLIIPVDSTNTSPVAYLQTSERVTAQELRNKIKLHNLKHD